MTDVKVGDVVQYVPHACHALDVDAHGERLFHFHHEQDGPIRRGVPAHRKGDVADLGAVGQFARRDDAGLIHTHGNYVLRPGDPKRHWPAVVRAVDGDRLTLEVRHPHGHTLGYANVPYDADGKAPHSWHQ